MYKFLCIKREDFSTCIQKCNNSPLAVNLVTEFQNLFLFISIKVIKRFKQEFLMYKMTDKKNNTVHMKVVDQEKDLRILFQEGLKFDQHISYIENKSNKLFGLIKRTFTFMDKILSCVCTSH